MLKFKCEDYSKVKKVKQLFKSFDYYLDIESIFKKHTGQIFIDNEKVPQTACIFNNQHNFYIAGKENNKEFNQSLAKYILNNIFPSMIGTNILDFNIDFDKEYLWEEEIQNMFEHHYVSKIERRYYVFDKKIANLNYELPKGYILRKIDEELLGRKKLKNIENIIEWTSTEGWLNKHDFIQNGFGFCIIKDQDIVSWCIADHVIGDKCEIGIETDKEYRKKGFATIVVMECIKFCLSNGIDNIGWHCFESNKASQKTAEKVGFKLCKKYSPYFGWYNGFDNYLVQAYECYNNKDYIQASKLYEKAFELIELENEEYKASRIYNKNNRFWFYFNSARANAISGNIDLSLNRLRKSIEVGLSNKEMVINEDAFKTLKKSNEFNDLIDNIG